jgi:hypothetical protein
MMFRCPRCQARIFTPTGVDVSSVECGNCGTTVEGPVRNPGLGEAIRTVRFWILLLALLAVFALAYKAAFS